MLNKAGEQEPKSALWQWVARWQWVMIALVPGLLSNVFLLSAFAISMNIRSFSEIMMALGNTLLYSGFFLPLPTPFYLFVVGRRYVRVVHGGYKSVAPFVLMYFFANLVLWACGLLIGVLLMKYPP